MTFPNNLRRSLRIITEINFRDNRDQSQKLEIRTRFKLLFVNETDYFFKRKGFYSLCFIFKGAKKCDVVADEAL